MPTVTAPARLPFSAPSGAAATGFMMGTLTLGLASVVVPVAANIAASPWYALVTVAAPMLLGAWLTVQRAKTQRHAITGACASGVAATLVAIAASRSPGATVDQFLTAVPGAALFGALAGLIFAPVIVAAARLRISRAYDAANTLVGIGALWLLIISGVANASTLAIGGLRAVVRGPLRVEVLLPMAVSMVAFAGVCASVVLHALRLRWLRRVYDGREPRWAIVAPDPRLTVASLPPLIEDAVLDAVLVERAHAVAGPFREGASETPVARVDRDRSRGLAPGHQTLYRVMFMVGMIYLLPATFFALAARN